MTKKIKEVIAEEIAKNPKSTAKDLRTAVNKKVFVKPKKIIRINVVDLLHHNLIEHPKESHKVAFGVVIMAVGVCISKIHVELIIVHYILDGVGYCIHGLGAIPIAELILNGVKDKK